MICCNDRILPSWAVAPTVQAFTTTRTLPGHSEQPYQQFNLADHVGDCPEHVALHRTQLQLHYALPRAPLWLKQTHSNLCIDAKDHKPHIEADACFSQDSPGIVLAVMTADCLPILLSNTSGTQIAAIHAGWKSLGTGIIEATLERFNDHNLHAWFGPAICQTHFEVGNDVFDLFRTHSTSLIDAFRPNDNQRYQLSLTAAASIILKQYQQIKTITDSQQCTYGNSEQFYSYRREKITGRIATLIWANV